MLITHITHSNHTIGISAGLNIGAHLDYGTLSVMCTEPFANSTSTPGGGIRNILQSMSVHHHTPHHVYRNAHVPPPWTSGQAVHTDTHIACFGFVWIVTTRTNSSRYPITPTLLGPGTVIGLERTITKVSGGYCWKCTPEEQITAEVYDREGFLVRTQRAVGRIELELDTGDGQIAVVTHAQHQGSQ